MKLLTCLVILLSFSMAVVAQPTDESESAEKKSPSRFDTTPAVPQILEEDLEMEMPPVVCARIRAFVFRMTEDKRLEYVGTTTCPPSVGDGLKKIDQPPPQAAPALYAY